MIVSKRREAEYARFLRVKEGYREIEKADEGKRVGVLYVKTVGSGYNRHFVGYSEAVADVNAVGEVFCDAYLIDERRPLRFARGNGRLWVWNGI